MRGSSSQLELHRAVFDADVRDGSKSYKFGGTKTCLRRGSCLVTVPFSVSEGVSSSFPCGFLLSLADRTGDSLRFFFVLLQAP